MPTSGLHELFAKELRLLYSAHQQGAKQADANIGTSTNRKLKRMLEAGSALNKKEAKRLEKVFASVNLAPSPRHDRTVAGIAEANNAATAETGNPVERDLINIAYGQVAAHLFLAKYGAARAYARSLGQGKAAALLQKTLDETGEVDRKFTRLAHEIVQKAKKAESSGKSGSGFAGQALTTILIVGTIAAGLHSVNQRQTFRPHS